MKCITKTWFIFVLLVINTAVFSQGKMQIKTGQTIPDFVLKNLAGEKYSLKDYKSRKIVYLNFFTISSARTRRDIAELTRIYGIYKKRNVEILGIAVKEKTEKLSFFVREFNISYPILLDSEGLIRSAYNIKTLPQSIIIDRKGLVRYVGLTPPEDFEAFLKELKAQKKKK
ncbi:MAG: TlpA family protein disulfide reductase [Elusimicrobia bacterium]|nr:TlpA family protein disulfide reductase [Elusimicrobiota bacterium]MBU2615087.1 TlpA family protein disulfide reductase [Elusimicrobiota bacterium]